MSRILVLTLCVEVTMCCVNVCCAWVRMSGPSVPLSAYKTSYLQFNYHSDRRSSLGFRTVIQTRPFYAHAQPTRPFWVAKGAGGKAVGRVFPMASHVGSTPSTTGYAWQERYNEKLGSLGTQMILTRLIPGRYSPDDVHGSMPHLSQPCIYSAINNTHSILYQGRAQSRYALLGGGLGR